MTDTELKNELDSMKKIQADATEALKKNQTEAFDKAMEAYDVRFAKLETDIKTAALSVPGNAPQENPQNKAFNAYLRSGSIDRENLTVSNVQDALTSTPGSNGGILVPPNAIQEIIQYSSDGNPMRDLAMIKQLSNGDTYPIGDMFGECESGWVGEKQTRAETGTQNYGQIQISLREVYARPEISDILLEDAAVDVEADLFQGIGRAFAKDEHAAFWNGAGPSQPSGILQYAKVADASWERGKFGFIAAGSTSTLSGDAILNLIDALADEYNPNATFVMKKTTWTKIKQLKAGTSGANQYLLWTPELVNGRLQNTLNGYPIKIVSQMDAISENSYPIAFGDFRKAYTIVDKVAMTIRRNPYIKMGSTFFESRKRTGGGATNTEAVKFLKMVAS